MNSGPKASDYVDSGISFVMANDLNKGVLTTESTSKIPENLAEKLRIGFSLTGDVLLTHKGTIGNTAIVPDISPYVMLTPQVTYYRVNPEILNNYYLMYCFRESGFQKIMSSLAQQSTRPYIGITAQRKLKVFYRGIDDQKKIVTHIKAYDDLINNNIRRIQLLEDAAKLLFNEWFVSLQFPGHEGVRIVNGVPEGWESAFASDIIHVNPTTRVEKGKEIFYIPMSALSESDMTADIDRFEKRTSHTSVKFKNGDVLFARITPCLENGKTGFVYFLGDGETACGSTEFIILRGNKVSPAFTYCLARSYGFRENAIKSMTGSSGRQRVQVECFNKFVVPVPPKYLLERFDEIADSSINQIKILTEQNIKLRKARDLLLPRLMNGDITV